MKFHELETSLGPCGKQNFGTHVDDDTIKN
jgi:hypothetical protein